MTRLGSPGASGRFGLEEAFRVLGRGPSRRELGWVVDLLRDSGIQEVPFDDALVEIAEAAGSSAFVALDLHTAVAFGVESLTRSGPAARPASALSEEA